VRGVTMRGVISSAKLRMPIRAGKRFGAYLG
jgi:hypothetical protein